MALDPADWLSPAASVVAALITGAVLSYRYKLKLDETKRQHRLEMKKAQNEFELQLRTIDHTQGNSVYDDMQENLKNANERNDKLYERIEEVERVAKERENRLDRKIDNLYRRINVIRTHAETLRTQLIQANIVPAPFPPYWDGDMSDFGKEESG